MMPARFRNVLVLALLVFGLINPQVKAQSPKREFRAVWVATVANIDWPSENGLSSKEQQDEIISILDRHRANGMNAIILQVRPSADAIYPSAYEPWSKYLSGEQGKAPEPWYDPLEFWITEAHRRGMELHAWFNPYRISNTHSESLVENHMALQHPEWCFNYGGRRYFSPANPQVWEFISTVVRDVVRRYDIDAVHFDDYFYPYAVAGESLPDSLEFSLFGDSLYPDYLDTWRRRNVDTVIHLLHGVIKAEKPWVKFGISPFGVWRNRSEDPLGSETGAGSSNYDGLYADVIKWQREGWIDYLLPQIYWRDDHPLAGFSTLAYWWNDFSYGRSLYIGLAPYRISRDSEYRLWKKEKYFLRQIDILRKLQGIQGYAFFSSKHFFRDDLTRLNKKLVRNYTRKPALVPEMPWIDRVAPEAPDQLRQEGNALIWDARETENEMDRSRFFVLYKFSEGDNTSLKSTENMILLTGENRALFREGPDPGIYRVSALDRLNNESQLSEALLIE